MEEYPVLLEWNWYIQPAHAVDMSCSLVYIYSDDGMTTTIKGINSVSFGAGMRFYNSLEAYGTIEKFLC